MSELYRPAPLPAGEHWCSYWIWRKSWLFGFTLSPYPYDSGRHLGRHTDTEYSEAIYKTVDEARTAAFDRANSKTKQRVETTCP